MKSFIQSCMPWCIMLLAVPAFHVKQTEVNMSATQTTGKNKEVIKMIYMDYFNNRRLDMLNDLVSDEYVGPRGEKGLAGYTEPVKQLLHAFPDIHWSVDDILEDGNRVVVRVNWKGTHKGAILGLQPTGKHVVVEAIIIYQFKDNRIVKAWMQNDRLGFLQQIGIIPKDVSTLQQAKN